MAANRTICISGIPAGLDLRTIESHFDKKKHGGRGDVESCCWWVPPTDQTLGSAMVTFEDHTTADSVLAHKEHWSVIGKNWTVTKANMALVFPQFRAILPSEVVQPIRHRLQTLCPSSIRLKLGGAYVEAEGPYADMMLFGETLINVHCSLNDSTVDAATALDVHAAARAKQEPADSSLDLMKRGAKYSLVVGQICTIRVYAGDICKEQCDAIVNAANSDLIHGGGIAAALSAIAGPNFQKNSDLSVTKNGKVSVGQARVTMAGGALPCKRVVHAVGPHFDLDCGKDTKKAEDLLMATYTSALREAAHEELASLAIPALSAGLFCVPPDVSATAAVRAMVAYVNDGGSPVLKDVRFVDTNADIACLFAVTFSSQLAKFGREAIESIDIQEVSADARGVTSTSGTCGNEVTDDDPKLSTSLALGKVRMPGGGSEVFKSTFSSEAAAKGSENDVVNGSVIPKRSVAEADLADITKAASADQDCVICMLPLRNGLAVEVLAKCSHEFHYDCIMRWFKTTPVCPICKTPHGIVTGTQPQDGRMSYCIETGGVPGFNCDKHVVIRYDFPNGIQGPEHQRPGTPYSGTQRTAYLPDTPHGQALLKMLELAFKNRLVFAVGDSITSGRSDTVVWNIHHKTCLHGGEYGYPDNGYLNRLEKELNGFGIMRNMVN